MQVEQMEQYLKWRGGIARGCVRNYKHRCEWRTELGITGRELERWTGARPHGPCGWQRVGILFVVWWELQEELSKLGTSSALN